MFVALDVLFKVTGKYFPLFGIYTLNVRRECKQPGKNHKGDDDGQDHRTLLETCVPFGAWVRPAALASVTVRAIKPIGNFSLARSFCSNEAISPPSDS